MIVFLSGALHTDFILSKEIYRIKTYPPEKLKSPTCIIIACILTNIYMI